MQLLTITFSLFAGKTREIQKAFQRIRRRLTCCQACSVPMLQLLLLLKVLNICVGADERSEEESGADPVVGDLVVNFGG